MSIGFSVVLGVTVLIIQKVMDVKHVSMKIQNWLLLRLDLLVLNTARADNYLFFHNTPDIAETL